MVGMLDSLSLKNTKLGLETLELMGYDRERIRWCSTAPTRGRHHARGRRGDHRPRARRPRPERPRDPALGQRGRADRAARRPRREAAQASASWPTMYAHERHERRRHGNGASRRSGCAARKERLMELHERLSSRRGRPPQPVGTATRSPSSRTGSTWRVIGDLGPQLFNVDDGPDRAARARGRPTSARTSRRRPGSRATTATGSSPRSPTTSSATGRSSGCSPTTP